MSKREDDLPDMEAGMTTAERRRRRRRGAGLRVPSDNVPRRSGSHSVVAPVPEDPNLAVSIAYSFAPDASGPMSRTDDDSLPELAAIAVEDHVEPSDVPEPVLDDDGPALAMTADEPPLGAEVDGRPIAVDDVAFDGKTREMPAVNLEALGLTFGSEPGEASREAAEAAEAAQAPVHDASELQDEADEPPAAAPDDAAPDEPTSELAAVSASAPEPVAEPAAEAVPVAAARPATAPIDASVDIELDEEPEAVPIARTFRRTTTMALSDEDLEDLEELLDGETTEHTGAPSPLAALVPSLRRGMRAPTPEPEALDESDLDAVQSPSDASDSGEILTEDLIEEVDAQAAPAVARKPAPEPEPEPSVVVAPEPASAPAPVPTPASPTTQAAVSNPAVAPPPAPAAPATKPPPAPKKAAVARAAAVAAASSPEAQTSSKKKRAKPWFEDLFDEDYLRTLPFLTPQATQAEARFVIDALALEPGAQVLDLGCGYGRHAMELAARGFHVVGLDSSLPLLLRGGDESQRRGLTINFVHGDMRELDFDAQFDGAYCLFSTFGFFDDETNKKTAANLARALKPGAKAVIEILNRDYLIGDLPTRVWWEGDGCVVLEEVEFNYFSSRIHSNRSVVFDDGRQLEQEISIRAYSLHELGKLLHSVGFRVLEVSGSIHTRGRFFGSHSRQILVVAERRAPSSKDPSEITRG